MSYNLVEIDPISGEHKLKKVAGLSKLNVWTGTQSDYNAQKNTIPNGSYVNITDDAESGNGIKDIYSTDEVKTNKVWIDGKPIYRKCFIVPESNWSVSESYSTLNVEFDFSDKTFIQASGSIRRTDGFEHQIGSVFSTLTINHSSTKPFSIFCSKWGTTASLLARVCLIVEYTKN